MFGFTASLCVTANILLFAGSPFARLWIFLLLCMFVNLSLLLSLSLSLLISFAWCLVILYASESHVDGDLAKGEAAAVEEERGREGRREEGESPVYVLKLYKLLLVVCR